VNADVLPLCAGKGDWITERAHAYGGKVIATVTTEKHAEAAVEFGADCLMATGHEAAAHGGDVSTYDSTVVPGAVTITKHHSVCMCVCFVR
jgi:NAD(P)H-dependent flavin oxidoreductase YrpB (nitropropane dioxygenase family)